MLVGGIDFFWSGILEKMILCLIKVLVHTTTFHEKCYLEFKPVSYPWSSLMEPHLNIRDFPTTRVALYIT